MIDSDPRPGSKLSSALRSAFFASIIRLKRILRHYENFLTVGESAWHWPLRKQFLTVGNSSGPNGDGSLNHYTVKALHHYSMSAICGHILLTRTPPTAAPTRAPLPPSIPKSRDATSMLQSLAQLLAPSRLHAAWVVFKRGLRRNTNRKAHNDVQVTWPLSDKWETGKNRTKDGPAGSCTPPAFRGCPARESYT